MTFAYAERARATEAMTDGEVTAAILAHLRDMYGPAVPAPRHMLRTRWCGNPNSYGAYSFTAVGTEMHHFNDLAKPVANKVFFAGEHTHAEYFSTAHGAYLSGIRAAREILARQPKRSGPLARGEDGHALAVDGDDGPALGADGRVLSCVVKRQIPRPAVVVGRQFEDLRRLAVVEDQEEVVVVLAGAGVLAAAVDAAGQRDALLPVGLGRAVGPVPADVGKIAGLVLALEEGCRATGPDGPCGIRSACSVNS